MYSTHRQSVAGTHRWNDESALVETWRTVDKNMKCLKKAGVEEMEMKVELVKEELMTVVVVVVVVVEADKCCGEGTRGTAPEKLRKSTELNRKITHDTK